RQSRDPSLSGHVRAAPEIEIAAGCDVLDNGIDREAFVDGELFRGPAHFGALRLRSSRGDEECRGCDSQLLQPSIYSRACCVNASKVAPHAAQGATTKRPVPGQLTPGRKRELCRAA